MSWRFGLAVVAVVVGLASCGASDDAARAPSRLATTQSPEVAALLGTPLTETDLEAEAKLLHSRSEELIAQCMAKAGFDYRPVPFDSRTMQPIPVTDTSLGVTNQFFGAFSSEFEVPAEDPNRAILQAMSDDERVAYREALQGEDTAFDPRFDSAESIQDAIGEQAANRSGCAFFSQQQALAETDRNPVLIDEYQQLAAGMIRTDQRLIRARVEWARCMAEAGFSYRDEGGIRTDLSDRATQLLITFQDEGVQLAPLEDPPPEARQRIDDLLEFEAAVAKANANCQPIIDDAIAEVRSDVDALFLERQS